MMCQRSPLVHRLKCLRSGLCCNVSLTDSGNREVKVAMLRVSQSCILQALFNVAAESMASRQARGENKASMSPRSSALVDEGS